MFCRTCGKTVPDQAIMCVGCGCPPKAGSKFCSACGAETPIGATVCPRCNSATAATPPLFSLPAPTVPGAEKKLVAGLCAILVGGWGVHKFILGYNNEGIITLLVTLLTCIGGPVMVVIGIIEGITYLTMSDEDFVNTYVRNKKAWF